MAAKPLPGHNALVEHLIDRIRQHEWTVGSQLPSERALALEYGLSRSMVREALAALQLAGYIQTRVGAGRYVAQSTPDTDSQAATLRTGESIAATLNVREAMELGCAYLAATHATPDDRKALRDLVNELERHVRQGAFDDYLKLTLDFHVQVATATGSSYLTEATRDLTTQHQHDQWLLADHYTPAIAERSLAVHRALADAIIRGDAPAALAAVAAHYEDYPALVADPDDPGLVGQDGTEG